MSRIQKKKKRSYTLPIIIGIVLLALVAGAIYKSKNRKTGTEVDSTEVRKRTITEMVGASGRIFPETEVKISSDVSGEIIELHVEEGDSVAQGQLLARIDPDALQSAVERGKASVNNARAMMAQSKSQIESSRAQKAQIQAQLDNLLQIYTRNKELANQGVISQQELEASEAQVRQIQANLSSAEASIKASQESAKASEYSVKSASASLRELQTNLKRTNIYAPTKGVVSQLNVEQGERVVGTIQMTGTELMRIANFSSMEAQVEVVESDILRVEIGQKADIEVDAYLDETFRGTVTEIAKSAANTTSGGSLTSDQVTYFIVKIRLDPASYAHLVTSVNAHPLRPGMSSTVDIYTNVKENITTVPIQAVTTRDLDEDEITEDIQEVVFKMESDTAVLTQVSTGIQDDNYIEVLAGLSEGDLIISGPYSVVSRKLEDGDKVRKKEKKDKN